MTPATASADNAPGDYGAPIMLAKAPAQPAARATRMQQSLAAIQARTSSPESPAVSAKTMRASPDVQADDLISTSLYPAPFDGPKKRNLEFSGRTGPKLQIGLKQKKVRFALNFKVVDDVFFAPAYRLAISTADFQNPDGYWAHSVFLGMRFNFNSDAK